MKEVRRGNRLLLRCEAKKCRTTCSLRASKKFFHFADKKGRPKWKLYLRDIVRLAYYFTTSTNTMKQVSASCGNNSHTVCVWHHLFWEVCSLAVEGAPKLVGSDENPIQIDEAHLEDEPISAKEDAYEEMLLKMKNQLLC